LSHNTRLQQRSTALSLTFGQRRETMDVKSATIVGVCIIIAALVLAFIPRPCVNVGRFQLSNPGEKGMAYVIDTVTGRVWQTPVGVSGGGDGAAFSSEKLRTASANTR
jgi:hypothetical protein